MFYPILTLVTASLYSIPFNLSLNTPVIDDVVYSIASIATCIAWTAYVLTVLSNPLKIVFSGAYPEASLPSCEESSTPSPCFFKAYHFISLSGRFTPNSAGINVKSIQSPTVPLFAIRLSL